MFTTGLMHLHQAGKVTNKKGYGDGYSLCTFAAGTSEQGLETLGSWLGSFIWRI